MLLVFLYCTFVLLVGGTILVNHPITGLFLWLLLLATILYRHSTLRQRKRPTR